MALQGAARAKELGLIRAGDRNGAATDRHSTEQLEVANERYRKACHEATNAVRAQLQLLAERVQVCCL